MTIELRSDTFTMPTKEMMDAMMSVELGDDVYGEDPTVNRLEEMAATLMGKEAAVLMPSGTMANLAAIMAHCPRGSKLVVGDESDIFLYEAGGASVCGGIMYESVKTLPTGELPMEELNKAILIDQSDSQFAIPSLICIENPHNRYGGVVLSEEYLSSLYNYTREHNILLHMDGARIFNAAIANKVPAMEIAQYADSIQFCLSKGLSAPIGSILAGEQRFINNARRVRKMLGGGMRQAGIVAAAGIVSLERMIERLTEDHLNAKRLAHGLSEIEGITILNTVETNSVLFTITNDTISTDQFIEIARISGINLCEFGYQRIRAVTHSGVTSQQVDEVIATIKAILRRGGS